MNTIKKLIAFLIMFLSSCQTASPFTTLATAPPRNVYYVASSGSDDNLGTLDQPWQTIQKAANSGNGTIHVSAGAYPERVNVSRPGLIFIAEGSVKMSGFTITANDTTIKGFDISTTSVEQPEGMGIYVEADNCVLENNRIHDTMRDGILIRTPSTNCIIRNNKIQHASQSGIEVQGNNNLIEGNEIWETVQYPPLWTNPPTWVDADAIRFFGSGHTIRGNYVHDIHYGIPENIDPHIDCFQTWGDAGRGIAHDIIFEQNYCDNPETMDGLAGKAWQIEGGAYNLTMRNNIVIANLIALVTDGHDIAFLHNTFIGDPGKSSEGVKAKRVVNMSVINNIFYYQQQGTGAIFADAQTIETLTAKYNCIYQVGGNRPPDIGEVNLDPLLTHDYHLQANSPCIDAGTNGSVSSDYDGNARPKGSGYDIGAFEYVVSP